MAFGVAITPKFAPRFLPVDSPLDFSIQYQIGTFLASQNVGFLQVAISGFLIAESSFLDGERCPILPQWNGDKDGATPKV